jgi:hypothetical protein
LVEKEENGWSNKEGSEETERRRDRNWELKADIDMMRAACLDPHLEHSSNSNLFLFSNTRLRLLTSEEKNPPPPFILSPQTKPLVILTIAAYINTIFFSIFL